MPSAVIVPASPAVVPALSGRSPELDDVRAAAGSAVRDLVVGRTGRVVVVADAPHAADETWTLDLHGYGLAGAPAGTRPLPVAYSTAAWLLDEAGWDGARTYVPPGVVGLDDGDVALVVADGTACRSDRAPGHLDARAAGVDARLAAALECGDLRVLAELDESLVAELLIGGVPALEWLRDTAAGRHVTAELAYSGAPLGVGLWVARWTWVSPAG